MAAPPIEYKRFGQIEFLASMIIFRALNAGVLSTIAVTITDIEM